MNKWERREMEWEGRVRKWLRVLWAVLGIGLGLFLVLGVVRCWPGSRPRHGDLNLGGNTTVEHVFQIDMGNADERMMRAGGDNRFPFSSPSSSPSFSSSAQVTSDLLSEQRQRVTAGAAGAAGAEGGKGEGGATGGDGGKGENAVAGGNEGKRKGAAAGGDEEREKGTGVGREKKNEDDRVLRLLNEL